MNNEYIAETVQEAEQEPEQETKPYKPCVLPQDLFSQVSGRVAARLREKWTELSEIEQEAFFRSSKAYLNDNPAQKTSLEDLIVIRVDSAFMRAGDYQLKNQSIFSALLTWTIIERDGLNETCLLREARDVFDETELSDFEYSEIGYAATLLYESIMNRRRFGASAGSYNLQFADQYVEHNFQRLLDALCRHVYGSHEKLAREVANTVYASASISAEQ